MKTNTSLLAAGFLLAAIGIGFGQPIITQQPQSCTNAVGTTATFWVVATGTDPLAYQWQKLSGDWTDLSGCTDTNLCLTSVQTSHAGDYRAIVSNVAGAVTSQVAQLTVVIAPRITGLSSSNLFLDAGANSSLRVTAAGTWLTYQWLFNGTPLVGATNSTLPLANAQPGISGEYLVLVSNLAGTATSQVARVKVFLPAAHSFGSLSLASNREIVLRLVGETTATFASYWDLFPLLVSSNLVDWTLLTTLQRANADVVPLTFRDTNASRFNQRFYRTPTNLLITPFPKPTGPFAIGTFSRVIIDPARTNRYRYNNQTNSFMLTCWYPAEPQAGLLPVAAWDNKVAGDSARYTELLEASSWATIVPQFKGYALPEAPIVNGTNRYPVILYSHGYCMHRKTNCRDAEELASQGYVVVGVDHEDCWGTEFPGGRYLTTAYHAPISESAVPYLIASRLKDLMCVIDEVKRMDVNDPWLAGRLDLNAVGTLGMSFGGSSTANLCRTNEVVKCAAFLDCAFHLDQNVELNQSGLQKPFLAMNNDNAAYPYLYFWPESTHLFDLAQTNAIIFQIHNTDHYSFFDFGWFFPVTQPWNRLTPGMSRAADACLVSFFNKYLKGQDDHFLDQAPPKYPDEIYEVINFRKK